MNYPIIPGERPYAPEEAELIKEFFLKACRVFGSFGYDYAHLSHFEPFSVQELAFGEEARKAITFKDTAEKEHFSLRLDFTTQVVRTLSGQRHLKLPERLFYFGNLFSLEGRGYESLQTGVELLGERSLRADAEVVEVLLTYLRSLGLKDLKVILGHGGAVKKLTAKSPSLRKALQERNLEALRRELGENFLPLIKVSEEEEALESLEKLGLSEERRELEEVARLLKEREVRVLYDLCELRRFPYYTGVTFEVFEEGGKVLAGGGRYDELSSLYGKELPATGGAVYLERLLELLRGKKPRKDYFIVDRSGRGLGEKLARVLRSKGKKVALELSDRPLEKSLSYAFNKGFKEVLLLEEEGLKIYTTPKDFVKSTLREFLSLLERA